MYSGNDVARVLARATQQDFTGSPSFSSDANIKVIYTKYSKHWPYTVAHTIDCVCSKMLNYSLNNVLFPFTF